MQSIYHELLVFTMYMHSFTCDYKPSNLSILYVYTWIFHRDLHGLQQNEFKRKGFQIKISNRNEMKRLVFKE
jgi:hypothetical protein